MKIAEFVNSVGPRPRLFTNSAIFIFGAGPTLFTNSAIFIFGAFSVKTDVTPQIISMVWYPKK